MILSEKTLSKLNFHQRRLVNYLMCKKGKPGQMLKNQGDTPHRLDALTKLIEIGLVKIVDTANGIIYFNFVTPQRRRKISISLGEFLD